MLNGSNPGIRGEIMLRIIKVNPDTCTRCGECVAECPERLFFIGKTGTEVLFQDPLGRCIGCGHCIAICPENAVEYSAEESPLEDPRISKPEQILGTEELYLFLKARRSIRRFRRQPIPNEKIKKILDIMRFAPTASNREMIHYTVITSGKEIAVFLLAVISLFRKVKNLLSFLRLIIPFGRRKPRGIMSNGLFASLNNFFIRVKAGEDPVFWGAPCVIIVSSPKYQHQAGVDAGIIMTHGMLAAQAEGLGTCLIGFAHETLLRNRRLRKRYQIPKGFCPQGVIVLGFPEIRFHRVPMRKPISCTWF